MKILLLKYFTWYLVLAMFIIGIAPRVEAGFIPSEMIDIKPGHRTADMETIQNALETKAVSERLSQLGLSQDEITERLSKLDNEQIHKLALQLDELKVGQDGVLGVIIALLVIAILVVVLLQITGHKIIITK